MGNLQTCSRNWCGWLRGEGGWSWALLCTEIRQLCHRSDWGTRDSKTGPCSQRNAVYFGCAQCLQEWVSVWVLWGGVGDQAGSRELCLPQTAEGRWKEEKGWIRQFYLVLICIGVINQGCYFAFQILKWTFSVHIDKFSVWTGKWTQPGFTHFSSCFHFIPWLHRWIFDWKLLCWFLPPPKKLPSLFLNNLIRNVINYLQVITLFCRLNILLWASWELQLQSHKANYALEYLVGLIWFEIILWRSRLCH